MLRPGRWMMAEVSSSFKVLTTKNTYLWLSVFCLNVLAALQSVVQLRKRCPPECVDAKLLTKSKEPCNASTICTGLLRGRSGSAQQPLAMQTRNVFVQNPEIQTKNPRKNHHVKIPKNEAQKAVLRKRVSQDSLLFLVQSRPAILDKKSKKKADKKTSTKSSSKGKSKTNKRNDKGKGKGKGSKNRT